jgi:dihydroorotate dehydrogenase (fumarate)
MASALLRHGIRHLASVETEIRQWMEEHEYESVAQMRGSMSQRNCPDPSSFERAQYMKAISTFKVA